MTEHTVRGYVTSLDDLRGEDGKFLDGTVNVLGGVYLVDLGLERLPVQFGTVGRNFICNNNLLTSLEGAPVTVGGNFGYGWNRLTSLEGAPVTVGGNFWCSGTRLTTLVGVHKIIKRIGGELYIGRNGIKAGGIGLVLVEGLTKIDADQPVFGIINKYLGQGMKGMLRCQEELHDAGFGEFARL